MKWKLAGAKASTVAHEHTRARLSWIAALVSSHDESIFFFTGSVLDLKMPPVTKETLVIQFNFRSCSGKISSETEISFIPLKSHNAFQTTVPLLGTTPGWKVDSFQWCIIAIVTLTCTLLCNVFICLHVQQILCFGKILSFEFFRMDVKFYFHAEFYQNN
jgi:hypothetical protein